MTIPIPPDDKLNQPMTDKQHRYVKLVVERKQCKLCEGMENPSRCAGGKFDSDEIGVWTTWQGGLDALVMIVGQVTVHAPGYEFCKTDLVTEGGFCDI